MTFLDCAKQAAMLILPALTGEEPMKIASFLAAVIIVNPAFAMSDADFQKKVAELSKQYNGAYNKKDAQSVANLFSSDGVFLLVDGKVAHGIDEIRKVIEGEFAQGGHGLSTSDIEGRLINNAGYAIGKFSLLFGDKDFKIDGSWSAAYVIDGETIKLKMLTGSIPPPPPK